MSAFPLYGCLSVLWLSTTLCLSLSPFVYGVKGEKRLRWWIVLRRYTCEETGRRLRRETLTMPQWAGSCWYYLRFADPRNGERLIGQEEEKCGDHTTVHSLTHDPRCDRFTIMHATDIYCLTHALACMDGSACGRSGAGTGCRWTCTSVAESTRRCISCTHGSGIRSSMISVRSIRRATDIRSDARPIYDNVCVCGRVGGDGVGP